MKYMLSARQQLTVPVGAKFHRFRAGAPPIGPMELEPAQVAKLRGAGVICEEVKEPAPKPEPKAPKPVKPEEVV